MNENILVFSGFNQRAVIAFLRTLEARKLPYAIIAISNNDPIFLTNYSTKVKAIRESVPLKLDDIVKSINTVKNVTGIKRFVIAPTAEALNRFLLQYRDEFARLGCNIPLVNKELYEIISDKYSFGELCKNRNINTPEEFGFEGEIQIPCVAKPKQYFSKDGSIESPYFIMNKDDKTKFLKTHTRSDFYFQEFINGKSFYLLYYFYKGGNVLKFSQENIIQQPDGKSVVAAISSNFHHSDESKKYEDLFKSLNYFGLVMVEVKQSDTKNYMIEANPRFWGPSQLFVDADVNLFEGFLYDHGFLERIPSFVEPVKRVKYFWFGGIIQTIKRHSELTYYYGNVLSLMDDLPLWLQHDIYRRKDTFGIFNRELIS